MYKTSAASIQSIGFSDTGIPFCFSELYNVFLCVIALPLSGTFKGHKISLGIFGESIFGPGIFGVLLEGLGILLCLDFWLDSIIPVT